MNLDASGSNGGRDLEDSLVTCKVIIIVLVTKYNEV